MQVFKHIHFVLDSMVSMDDQTLNCWSGNSADLVFIILVNYWVISHTANCVVAVMVRLDPSIQISHILYRFMALNFGFQNEVLTCLVDLILFVLRFLSSFFVFGSALSSLMSISEEAEFQVLLL